MINPVRFNGIEYQAVFIRPEPYHQLNVEGMGGRSMIEYGNAALLEIGQINKKTGAFGIHTWGTCWLPEDFFKLVDTINLLERWLDQSWDVMVNSRERHGVLWSDIRFMFCLFYFPERE